MQFPVPFAIAAVVLAGCASTGADDASDLPSSPTSTSVRSASYTPQEAGETAAVPAPKQYTLSSAALELWNDPRFEQWVTQSYAAETDVEPPYVADETQELLKILELIGENDMDRAMKRLEKNRGSTASAAFDFTAANIAFQNDDLDAAIEGYTIAVQKYRKFLRAWRQLGIAYVRAAEYEGAVEALTQAVALGSADAFTYGLLGYSYGNLGQSLSAESAYRMAVLLDPQTLDWRIGLARSLFRQERFADAAALCGQLIREQPGSADMWLLQANAYIGMGRPMRAAENYELVAGLGKATFASMNNLGDIYVNAELYDQGVDSYLRAMELDPNGDPSRAVRAAKILVARGALAETERLVEHLEERHGATLPEAETKELLELQARLAVAQGADEEQVRVLERIVELDPLDGEALILLGDDAWEREGDAEKAIFLYERAAAIEAFEAEAKVAHAQLLVRRGDYAGALPLLRRAQTLEPRPSVQEYLEQIERFAKHR